MAWLPRVMAATATGATALFGYKIMTQDAAASEALAVEWSKSSPTRCLAELKRRSDASAKPMPYQVRRAVPQKEPENGDVVQVFYDKFSGLSCYGVLHFDRSKREFQVLSPAPLRQPPQTMPSPRYEWRKIEAFPLGEMLERYPEMRINNFWDEDYAAITSGEAPNKRNVIRKDAWNQAGAVWHSSRAAAFILRYGVPYSALNVVSDPEGEIAKAEHTVRLLRAADRSRDAFLECWTAATTESLTKRLLAVDLASKVVSAAKLSYYHGCARRSAQTLVEANSVYLREAAEEDRRAEGTPAFPRRLLRYGELRGATEGLLERFIADGKESGRSELAAYRGHLADLLAKAMPGNTPAVTWRLSKVLSDTHSESLIHTILTEEIALREMAGGRPKMDAPALKRAAMRREMVMKLPQDDTSMVWNYTYGHARVPYLGFSSTLRVRLPFIAPDYSVLVDIPKGARGGDIIRFRTTDYFGTVHSVSILEDDVVDAFYDLQLDRYLRHPPTAE